MLNILPRQNINPENAVPMDFFGDDVDKEIEFDKLFRDCVVFVS